MIIHHQRNVAAFAGNHIWYWPLQPLFQARISVTTVAPPIVANIFINVPSRITSLVMSGVRSLVMPPRTTSVKVE